MDLLFVLTFGEEMVNFGKLVLAFTTSCTNVVALRGSSFGRISSYWSWLCNLPLDRTTCHYGNHTGARQSLTKSGSYKPQLLIIR
ncbi:hypothetical protein M514_06819 [Trichuris suis]|uniref:Uncharacterized protein n=1 Tax=Trichuris suis TaxID=68888 RepID=A0A085NB73_9BILA|nr:hypothetical protein M514_06819 [Trichuris suis]